MGIFRERKSVLSFLLKSWGVGLVLFSSVVYAGEVAVNFTPQSASVREGGSVQMNMSITGSPDCRVGIRSSGTAFKGSDYSISVGGRNITATLDTFFVDINTTSASDASDAIGSGSVAFLFSAIARDVAESNETANY